MVKSLFYNSINILIIKGFYWKKNTINIKIENIDLVQDKELLEVLLTNIIDNSIKASNVGSWMGMWWSQMMKSMPSDLA